MECATFVVRTFGGHESNVFNRADSANKEAQALANKSQGVAGVYELIKEFKPEPQPVTCDIDKLIERMEQCDVNSCVACSVYGMLKRLKTFAGVESLDMPPGFKL